MWVAEFIYLVRHEIISPDAILRSHIRYFWTLQVARNITGQQPVRTFVDDSSGIVIEFELGHTAYIPRRTMVYGQTTSPTENRNNPSFFALGVLFQPLAIKELFGIDAHELTDRRIHLDEFSKLPFTGMISAVHSMPEVIQLLSDYLVGKIAAVKKQDMPILHCTRYIKGRAGSVTVKELCAIYQVSERQLERKFLSAIGVTPRHYIKITRFKAALALLSARSFDKFSDIAYHLNYFDQAHFIRQTKELSGLSPRQLQHQLNIRVANIFL